MMLNRLPANIPLNAILNYLGDSTGYNTRNRALYAIRQELRIKDIAALQVADILTTELAINRVVVSPVDGTCFQISDQLASELHEYLIAIYDLTGTSLKPLSERNIYISLFPTQKRTHFTANTLAQLYCHLDKQVDRHFNQLAAKKSALALPKKTAKNTAKPATTTQANTGLLAKIFSPFAQIG